MTKQRLLTSLVLIVLLICGRAQANTRADHIREAESLIERVTPQIASRFKLSLIPAQEGKDVFEVESKEGFIHLAGNNAISLASAYNHYLKHYCHCLYSLWGDQMQLPDELVEVPEKVRRVCERELRHFFNYCTFNYSGSWWDWEDWEKIIDFLAMNGVNMPLQIVGTEAVWYHTLRGMGFSDLEARGYLAAPVYLNWQWMGNLEGGNEPLPRSWIDSHEKLGRKIMEREQALGMTPIVHGFSGCVPRLFQEKFPQANIGIKPGWARGSFLGTATLDPMDPLFATTAKLYLTQLIERIGTSHYYITDPFHESHPPVEGDKYLQDVAKNIDKVLLEVDPEAIWVTQDWSLRPQIIQSIDKDRLIIMSLTGGKCATYSDWGYRFLTGQLNNFGGQTYLHGPMLTEAENGFAKWREKSPNCVGAGLWMEDIESASANYQMMLDLNWEPGAIDLKAWFADYAHARYGAPSQWAEKANDALSNSAYKRGSRNFSSMIAARPAVIAINSGPSRQFEIPGGFDKYVDAWRFLLMEGDRFKHSDGYRYDVVDYGRQVLSYLAQYYKRDITIHLYNKDIAAFRIAKKRFLDLFDDMDRLLATNSHFMFGKWIADARSWATNKEESDYYSKYAALLPTLWGQDNMECPRPNWYGYAWREWSGLVGTFYKYRWSYFLDEVERELLKGNIYRDCARDKWGRPEFRGDPVLDKLADWEWSYIENIPEIPSEPQGDPISVARELFGKYSAHLLSLPSEGPVFGGMFKSETIDGERIQVPVESVIQEVLGREAYIK